MYELAEKNDFNVKTIHGRKKPVLALILLFPLCLFSWLNNLIPYQAVRRITSKVIKDHAFDASIKFLLGLILFPLFWILASSILWLSGVPVEFVIGYFGLSIATSVLFKNANLIVREAKEKRQLEEFSKTHPEEYKEFINGIKILNEFRSEVL